MYRAATFATKREAKDWAIAIEAQANHIAAGGYAPVPKGSTLGDLIVAAVRDANKKVAILTETSMPQLPDLGGLTGQ